MRIDLRHGDCLEVMAGLPDACVDMVLCDLPYGTTRNKWDSVIPLDALWAQYRRVAKASAAIVLTAQCPFDKVLGASNLDWLRYEWIWEKSEATGHLNAKKQPMKAHENVLVFYRGQPTYNPQMTKGAKLVTAKQLSANGSANYGAQRPTFYQSDERYPRSVIQFAKDNKNAKIHPTQKPVALMEYLVRTYSNPGDTVLDNCMGSGTTGVACRNAERRFIGIEKDETYFKAAAERILAACPRLVA